MRRIQTMQRHVGLAVLATACVILAGGAVAQQPKRTEL